MLRIFFFDFRKREHIYECLVLLFRILAERPGVAHGKKVEIFFLNSFFYPSTPPATQPCSLAGYMQHKYSFP